MQDLFYIEDQISVPCSTKAESQKLWADFDQKLKDSLYAPGNLQKFEWKEFDDDHKVIVKEEQEKLNISNPFHVLFRVSFWTNQYAVKKYISY